MGLKGRAFDPANAGITGGTIANATITGATITQSNVAYSTGAGIPLIHISSGSISAIGALTGITALPAAYAHAYIYLPANAVATVAAAGWYYATFSTTTAGTVFLNTYTSGMPTIPAAPTALTDGKGAYTGVTAEVVGISVPIAAGAMGNNGRLDIHVYGEASPNSANVKSTNVRFAGIAGTSVVQMPLTSAVRGWADCFIQNMGISTAQISGTLRIIASASITATTMPAVATASATTVDYTLNKDTATENVVLTTYQVSISYRA